MFSLTGKINFEVEYIKNLNKMTLDHRQGLKQWPTKFPFVDVIEV